MAQRAPARSAIAKRSARAGREAEGGSPRSRSERGGRKPLLEERRKRSGHRRRGEEVLKRSFVLAFLLGLSACDGCKDKPPPSPAPAASSVVAPVTSASSASSVAPTAFPSFAGFSKDGRSFSWLAPRGESGAQKWRKTIGVGEKEPKRIPFDGEYEPKIEELKREGFSADRLPPPGDLKVEAHLQAKPPKIVLERNGRTVDVPAGNLPYAPTDAAEIWGASADRKHVAVHISGTGHDYVFVAPVP